MRKLFNKKDDIQVIEQQNNAPKGFVFIKQKYVSKKKVKRQNTITTILFLIGFILPTALAIYKKMNMDTTNAFEQYYFYIFIGLIALDILIYLPIFFINKSLVRKNNNKKLLLGLLTIRKIEKLVMAVYSLSFIFYGLPEGSINFSLSGIITAVKSNLLVSLLSVLTALTSLLSKNKKLVNEVSSELLKTNTKLQRYEYDQNGNVVVKIYKRKDKKSFRYAIRAKLLTSFLSSLFGVLLLVGLVYLLTNM